MGVGCAYHMCGVSSELECWYWKVPQQNVTKSKVSTKLAPPAAGLLRILLREYFYFVKISDLYLCVHLILETSVDSGGVSLQALPVTAGNEPSRISKFQNHRKGPYYVIRLLWLMLWRPIFLSWVDACAAYCFLSILNVKALVGSFNQEKAITGNLFCDRKFLFPALVQIRPG